MIKNAIPLGLPVEERAGGVYVDDLAVHERAVPLLRVFLGGVAEEARAHRLLHAHRVLTR